jgi:hypothetical protein
MAADGTEATILIPCLEGTEMKSDSMPVRPVCDAPVRWMHCFCYFCLVLSIPWSIWVTNGWIGVYLHFQVASGCACLLERILRGPRIFRETV